MKHNRKTEFLLLLAVQVVLLFGLALVYLGKQATSDYPAQPFNVNTAMAGQFAGTLSISKETAGQLVAERDAHRGHAWASVSGLRHAKALQDVPTAPIDDRFVARTAAEVAHAFWGGTAAFLLVFWLAHAILRKSASVADPFLLPFTALLSGLGLMMVYSVKDPYRDTFVFSGQLWGVALYGILALLLPLTRPFGRLPLRRYQYAYAGMAVFLMLLLLVLGHGPGGIHIQVFGFEPIEIIKLLLVLFVASYLAERRGAVNRLADFGPLALVYAFCLGLFLLVKDLGPAVLLFGVFLALLYLTTRRLIYPLLGTGLLLLAAFAGYALHFGFFATRVVMWLHPWDNSDKNGAQLAQGLWGMATGGLWGSGLGLGGPEFVPRAGSDSVFATLGEQLGLVGGLVILAVYALLIARGLHIARRAVTEFDRLLAAGLTPAGGPANHDYSGRRLGPDSADGDHTALCFLWRVVSGRGFLCHRPAAAFVGKDAAGSVGGPRRAGMDSRRPHSCLGQRGLSAPGRRTVPPGPGAGRTRPGHRHAAAENP